MRTLLVLLLALAVPTAARAQTAAEHVAAGDREHAALNPAAALRHYEAALAASPNDFDALWKASREAVDLGEFGTTGDDRSKMFRTAEQYARRAVQINPSSAVAHFSLAKALGRTAQSLGPKDKVRYAKEVRAEALEALRLDPQDAGSLHVMGMWNAEIMRLNGLSRFLAKKLLGGQVFEQANWGDAAKYMERAVTLEPNRLTHHLDLAGVFADTDQPAKAREQYEAVLRLPATEYTDRFYKQEAEKALKDLK